jgi:molecular chaperone GrpE
VINIKDKKKEAKIEESKQENEQLETIEPQAKIDPKDSQIEELTDTLKRLQAEFENYKKRIEKENAAHVKNANSSLVKELLPVMDSFELALKDDNCENPEIAKYRKGLELIYSQLYSILEDYGLKVIDAKNQKFDPYKHEVLMVKESTEPDDTILHEFQKGYILNDNIIRHTKVMISKHKVE